MRLRLLAATAAVCAGALGLAACGDAADDTADVTMETTDEAMADEAMADDADMAAAEEPAAEPAPAVAPPAPPPAELAIDTLGAGETIEVTLPDAIDPETGEVNTRFTGYGENVSPAIQWTAVDGAQSYVVVLQDPVVMADNSTFMVLHWAAYNIPGTSLPEAVPAGAEIPGGGMQIGNLMGNTGYSGMQPPANRPQHQYTWQVFALDTMLDSATITDFGSLTMAMQGHVIGSGSEVTPFSPPADAQPMQGVSLPDDHPLLAD